MTKKHLPSLITALVCGTTLCIQSVRAQVTLTGTNYTQNFDSIGNGLPAGWSVRTNASATSLGTAATFNTSAVSWGTSTGQFGDQAGTTNNSGAVATGSETSTSQGAFTNRCPAIRQVANNSASFPGSDPGAAFVFQIANTKGLSNLTFSVDLNMLSVQGHSTTWTIDYAVGNSPTSFTTLGTYSDPGVFGTTTVTYNLGTDANDQSQNVWIRAAALSVSTGSGSRDTFGIDNFNLNYSGPLTPTISSQPMSVTNGVLTTATLAVAASGSPPLSYQWFDGSSPLSDGGNISGSTNDMLILTQLVHTNAGNYSVIITNNYGSVTSQVAKVTIVGFAIAPLPPTNTVCGTPVTVPLSFIDNQLPVTAVSGTSGNQNILPDANISGSASGNSGSATLTPVTGSNGVVLVSLAASDGSFSTNTIFPLMVVPSTNVIFNDHFDYANGSVTANSFGVWSNHSGPAGQMTVTNGTLLVSRSLDEDANALLIGGPYDTNSTTILYSRFNVKFTTLPTTAGNYFAHFKEATNLGFAARIWASTANTNTAGTFRLGIGNSGTSTATTAQFPLDLSLNTNYSVVTRLVLSNGISTLWINPTNETDPSVTAADAVTNPITVAAYAFREDGSEGIMQVDDLAVGTSFNSVIGGVSPIPLYIQLAGTNVVLTWSNSTFSLQAAPLVTGVYTNIPAAISPFTNGVDSPKEFYRLAH